MKVSDMPLVKEAPGPLLVVREPNSREAGARVLGGTTIERLTTAVGAKPGRVARL